MNRRPLRPFHAALLMLGVIPPLPPRKDPPESQDDPKPKSNRTCALHPDGCPPLCLSDCDDPPLAIRIECTHPTHNDPEGCGNPDCWKCPLPDTTWPEAAMIIGHPPCVPFTPHSVSGRESEEHRARRERVHRSYDHPSGLSRAALLMPGMAEAVSGFKTIADAAGMAGRAMQKYTAALDATVRPEHRALDSKRFVYPVWEIDPPTTPPHGYHFKPWEERELRPLLKRYNRAVRRMLTPGTPFNADIYRDHDRIMGLIAGDIFPPHVERLTAKRLRLIEAENRLRHGKHFSHRRTEKCKAYNAAVSKLTRRIDSMTTTEWRTVPAPTAPEFSYSRKLEAAPVLRSMGQ